MTPAKYWWILASQGAGTQPIPASAAPNQLVPFWNWLEVAQTAVVLVAVIAITWLILSLLRARNDLEEAKAELMNSAVRSENRIRVLEARGTDAARSVASDKGNQSLLSNFEGALHNFETRLLRLEQSAASQRPEVQGAVRSAHYPTSFGSHAPVKPQPSASSDQRIPSAPGIPADLTDSDSVVVTQKSAAMVEVRVVSEKRGTVFVNSSYRFSDVNARLLVSAFEVEGNAGAGTYATLEPATVEWSGNEARQGRIMSRGRIKLSS